MNENTPYEISLKFTEEYSEPAFLSENAFNAYQFLTAELDKANGAPLPIMYEIQENRTMAQGSIGEKHGYKAVQITLGRTPEKVFPEYEVAVIHELGHALLQSEGVSCLKNTQAEDAERCAAITDMADHPAIFTLSNKYRLPWDTHFDLGRIQNDFADPRRVKRSEAFEKHPFNIAKRYSDLYFINPKIYAYILQTLPELVNGNKVLELLAALNKHRDELGKKIYTVEGVKEIKARLLDGWKFPYEQTMNFPKQSPAESSS